MADKSDLVGMLKSDVQKFNQFRTDNPSAQIDLAEVELANIDLKKADFKRIKLQGSNFTGADLKGAEFVNADLTNANLSKTDLLETSLHRANLRNADLRGANLGTFAEPCVRLCLHEASFKDVHYSKEQLETILAVINLNADFEVKYELKSKKG